jgi:uncharacterized membrane protein (DUF485 family)
MSKSDHWMLKSLAVGAALALITFALFYGFLTIHTESGVARTSSYKLAILAFLVGTIAAAIYLRFRTDR